MREAGGGWCCIRGGPCSGWPVAGLEDGPLLERFAGLDGDAAEAAFAAPRRQARADGPPGLPEAARRPPRRRRRLPGDLPRPRPQGPGHPSGPSGWPTGSTAPPSGRLGRLRADLARRRGTRPPGRPDFRGHPDPDRSEEAEIVLEEVARLPQACRVAVVLCDLEGLTQEEAARRPRLLRPDPPPPAGPRPRLLEAAWPAGAGPSARGPGPGVGVPSPNP